MRLLAWCAIGNSPTVQAELCSSAMLIDRKDIKERLARIEQMIEDYRVAKEDRLLRRAIKVFRKAEVQKQLVELEAEPERIH